jgi:hypothetical protein
MPAPRDVHRGATRVLSAAIIVLGVAMLVLTLVNGGGPISTGVLLGVLFIAAGAGRLWIASKVG